MHNVIQLFTLSNLTSSLRIIVDIGIIWLIFYYALKLVQTNYRTLQIVKGIIVILLIRLVSKTFDLEGVEYIVDAIMNWGVIALIIVFQPEIRSVLEKIGQVNLKNSSRIDLDDQSREELVNELTKAVNYLANNRVGAIISIERSQSLEDYIEKATPIDAMVTYDLLLTIFYEGTTLHDGAVIIRNNRIACASAFYPPTHRELPPVYGARHRASIGLSEVSDALTIVVSEESGNVSFALGGQLIKVPLVEFKDQLQKELFKVNKEVSKDE